MVQAIGVGGPVSQTDEEASSSRDSGVRQSGMAPATAMRVKKRNGDAEPVDVNKIVKAVSRSAQGLGRVDSMRVALKTIGGLFDGATTQALDQLSIQTAASLIAEEPEYSRLAARLLATFIDKEVQHQDVHSFSQSIGLGHRLGLVNDRVLDFVTRAQRKLNDALENDKTDRFEYFGLRTVYDR
jgi:ribonucleoside-diphosphate reductase alpha chain